MPLFKIQRKNCALSFKEIDEETPLMPEFIAQIVVEEASDCVGEELPKTYAMRLARKVREFYRLNPDFRREMRRPGNSGRDKFYWVNRHWLAAWLYLERPELYDRLPREYAVTYGAERIRPKLNSSASGGHTLPLMRQQTGRGRAGRPLPAAGQG